MYPEHLNLSNLKVYVNYFYLYLILKFTWYRTEPIPIWLIYLYRLHVLGKKYDDSIRGQTSNIFYFFIFFSCIFSFIWRAPRASVMYLGLGYMCDIDAMSRCIYKVLYFPFWIRISRALVFNIESNNNMGDPPERSWKIGERIAE